MTIDGVSDTLYDEVYSDALTREDRQMLDALNIEWRGRGVAQIWQDLRIYNILASVWDYYETARLYPQELPAAKEYLILSLQDILKEPEPEPCASPRVYRYDPVSGAYLENLSDMRSGFWKTIKGWKHDIGHGVRYGVRWLSDHSGGSTTQISVPVGPPHHTPISTVPQTVPRSYLPPSPYQLPASLTPSLQNTHITVLPAERPHFSPSGPPPPIFTPSRPYLPDNHPPSLHPPLHPQNSLPGMPLPQTIIPPFHFANNLDTTSAHIEISSLEQKDVDEVLIPVSSSEEEPPPKNEEKERAPWKVVGSSWGAEVSHFLINVVTILPRGAVSLMDLTARGINSVLPEANKLPLHSAETEETMENVHKRIDKFFNSHPTNQNIAQLEMPIPTPGLFQRIFGALTGRAAQTNKIASKVIKGSPAAERTGAAMQETASAKNTSLLEGKSIPAAQIVARCYPDPKFAIQLEKQLENHGTKSILKSHNSIKQLLEEHKQKLPELEFKSSVEREISTFEKQLETLEQFAIENKISLE